jgi:hypothetical protein
MERLSTGVRINSAADDAAGLAISTRMTSDIRGLAVAIRNANDGISLAQTAEGAIGEVTNILQRMRELAVQSESGTYTDANRHSMQLEFANNIAEIQNIFQTTNFNSIKLFDGSASGLQIQSGVNSNDTKTIRLTREDVQDLLSIFAGKQSAPVKSTYAKILNIVNAIVPAADWKIPLYQMTDFIPNGGHRLVTQDQVGISPNGSTIAGFEFFQTTFFHIILNRSQTRGPMHNYRSSARNFTASVRCGRPQRTPPPLSRPPTLWAAQHHRMRLVPLQLPPLVPVLLVVLVPPRAAGAAPTATTAPVVSRPHGSAHCGKLLSRSPSTASVLHAVV